VSSTTIRYSGVPENSHSRDFDSDDAAYASSARHEESDTVRDTELTRRFRAAAAADQAVTAEPEPAAPSAFVPGFTPGKAGPVGDDPRHNRVYPHPKNPGLFADEDGFYDWADRRLFLADGSPDPMTPGAYRYQTRPDLCDLDASDADPSSPRYEPEHLRHKPGDTWLIDDRRPYDVLDPGPFGSPGWFPDRRTGRHRRDELPDPIPWWEIEEEPEKAEWAERAEALWERRTRITREREAREARAREAASSGETAECEPARTAEPREHEASQADGTRERGARQAEAPHGLRGSVPAQTSRAGESGASGRSGPTGGGSGRFRRAVEGDPGSDSEGRHSQGGSRDGSDDRGQGPSSGHRGGSGAPPQGPSWGYSREPWQDGSRGVPERRPEYPSRGRASGRTEGAHPPGPSSPGPDFQEPYRFSKLREDAWDQFLLKSAPLAAAHLQPSGGSGRMMRIVGRIADVARRTRKRYRVGTRSRTRPAGTEVPRQRTRPRPSPGPGRTGAPLAWIAGAPKEAASVGTATECTADARTTIGQALTDRVGADHGATPNADVGQAVINRAATDRAATRRVATDRFVNGGGTDDDAAPGAAAAGPVATGRDAFDPGAVARRTARMASAFRGAERARAELAEKRGVRIPDFGGAAWA
jgi:hypothetical protein